MEFLSPKVGKSEVRKMFLYINSCKILSPLFAAFGLSDFRSSELLKTAVSPAPFLTKAQIRPKKGRISSPFF
jgi:hypothetical protein